MHWFELESFALYMAHFVQRVHVHFFFKLTIIILGVREYLNGKLCNKHKAKDFPFFGQQSSRLVILFCNSPA